MTPSPSSPLLDEAIRLFEDKAELENVINHASWFGGFISTRTTLLIALPFHWDGLRHSYPTEEPNCWFIYLLLTRGLPELEVIRALDSMSGFRADYIGFDRRDSGKLRFYEKERLYQLYGLMKGPKQQPIAAPIQVAQKPALLAQDTTPVDDSARRRQGSAETSVLTSIFTGQNSNRIKTRTGQ